MTPSLPKDTTFPAPAVSRRTIFATHKNQRRTENAHRNLELGNKERGTVEFAHQAGRKGPDREPDSGGPGVRNESRGSGCEPFLVLLIAVAVGHAGQEFSHGATGARLGYSPLEFGREPVEVFHVAVEHLRQLSLSGIAYGHQAGVAIDTLVKEAFEFELFFSQLGTRPHVEARRGGGLGTGRAGVGQSFSRALKNVADLEFDQFADEHFAEQFLARAAIALANLLERRADNGDFLCQFIEGDDPESNRIIGVVSIVRHAVCQIDNLDFE